MPTIISQSKLDEMHAKSNSEILENPTPSEGIRRRKIKFTDGVFKGYIVRETFFEDGQESLIQQYMPNEIDG